jgi:hypothetical protein
VIGVGSAARNRSLKTCLFIVGTKYYKTLWCVEAGRRAQGPCTSVGVRLPLVTFKLCAALDSMLRTLASDDITLKRMVLHRHALEWTSLTSAMVADTSTKRCDPKMAPKTQAPKRPRVGEDFETPGEEEASRDFEFDLAAELSGLWEAEQGDLLEGAEDIPDACPDDADPRDADVGDGISVAEGVDDRGASTSALLFPFEVAATGAAAPSTPAGDILDLIQQAVCSGRDVVADAHEAAKARKDAPLQRHGISLVKARVPVDPTCSGAGTVLVRWESPVARQGRPVRVDELNRIIYQMLSVSDYVDADVILPDIGVAMSKARGLQRTLLPRWVVTLRAVADASLNAGPQENSPCMPCAISARQDVRAHRTAMDGDAYCCHSCLCAFHMGCNGLLARLLNLEARPCQATEAGVSFTCCVCLAS